LILFSLIFDLVIPVPPSMRKEEIVRILSLLSFESLLLSFSFSLFIFLFTVIFCLFYLLLFNNLFSFYFPCFLSKYEVIRNKIELIPKSILITKR
jgi:hypothetical protein